jgi:type IV pilus assembly protein PilA
VNWEKWSPLPARTKELCMKNAQSGFTLIELMIAVAIVGILSAIAIPAYQDFTIRSKVTELIHGASACKASVQEYFNSQGVFPPAGSAGCSTDGTANAGAPSVNADTGVITVTARGPLGLRLAGNGSGTTIQYTPVINGASITAWDCKTGTTVTPKYLPATCR